MIKIKVLNESPQDILDKAAKLTKDLGANIKKDLAGAGAEANAVVQALKSITLITPKQIGKDDLTQKQRDILKAMPDKAQRKEFEEKFKAANAIKMAGWLTPRQDVILNSIKDFDERREKEIEFRTKNIEGLTPQQIKQLEKLPVQRRKRWADDFRKHSEEEVEDADILDPDVTKTNQAREVLKKGGFDFDKRYRNTEEIKKALTGALTKFMKFHEFGSWPRELGPRKTFAERYRDTFQRLAKKLYLNTAPPRLPGSVTEQTFNKLTKETSLLIKKFYEIYTSK